MDRKTHWENVYATKSHKEVSWFTEHIHSSIKLIAWTKVAPTSSIIDVGGGAATLVDDLLAKGYTDVTVIDISGHALKIAQDRLGQKSDRVQWIEADVLQSDFGNKVYDLWHDRAVFHFLTTEEERLVYRHKITAHLKVGGFIVLSVFAENGPQKCSMLEVKRHSVSDIEGFFGHDYEKVFEEHVTHLTPANVEQKFVNVVMRRIL